MQVGEAYVIEVASKSFVDRKVTFPEAFPGTPRVFCSMRTKSQYTSYGSITPVPVDASASGFTIRLYNDSDIGAQPSVNWLAVYDGDLS